MRKALALKYVNSQGIEIDFGNDGYPSESNEMRGFLWEYEISRNKVKRFYKSPSERALETWIDAYMESVGYEMRDKLLEIIEYDVRVNKPGRFYVGDYYCEGFIIASDPQGYISDGRQMVSGYTVLIPNPNWYRPNVFQFPPIADAASNGYLDLPTDLPADLKPPTKVRTFTNPTGFESDFKLTIFGYAREPAIRIGRNLYQVHETLQTPQDRIEIDSRDKTIKMISGSGLETNVFNSQELGAQGSGVYVFEKIPAGFQKIIAATTFGFELVVLEERSAPKWGA